MLLPPLENYSEFVRSYQRADLETFNYVDLIDDYARDPDRLAMVWCNADGTERRLSFRELAEESARVAEVLRTRGVERGERVLIMFPRCPEWAVACLAVLRIGAVMCSCVTMLQPRDLQYRIGAARPAAILADADQVGKFEGIADDVPVKIAHGLRGRAPSGWSDWANELIDKPRSFENVQLTWDEPASLYFTSGSTGAPKGVVHGAHFAHYLREVSAYWLDLNEQKASDLLWCTADTGWALAATGWLVGPWLAGVAVFIYDGPFDARTRLELLAKYRVTVFCAPATELRWIVTQAFEFHDLSSLRLTVSTGEMLDPPTAQRWRDQSEAPLHEAFGQTESFMTIANMTGQPTRAGSMGRAVPGFDLEILDPDSFAIAAPGTTGHIAIRQPTRAMMLGYWENPEKTAEVFRDGPDGRWYLTGDLARRDEDGYFYYEGRADDVINSAGYRIGPAEVEAALMDHAAVKDCAAVGSPDPQRGEVVKAFVILNDDWLDASMPSLAVELQAHVKATTAPYKYPRKLEFVEELPRTATGKVRRKTLRDREYAAEEETRQYERAS